MSEHEPSPYAPTPSSSAADAAPFHWKDGTGMAWTLEVDPERLVLTRTGERFALLRGAWRETITFSPVGSQVVIHFDTGTREIGFMVTQAQARELFSAMGRRPIDSEPHPVRAEPRLSSGGSPLWPKMSALPVVALFAAVLAFLPVVGALFGLLAVALALVARRKTRDNAAGGHIRAMARVSVIIAVLGLGVCALGTYTLLRVRPAFNLDEQLIGHRVEWSTGAIIAAIVMVVISLSVHEAAHAITAWWFGDGYARSQGRVTLNPLAHIDLFGTVILPILLASVGAPVFGYAKPVPVQLSGVRRPRLAQVLVSAAGPASNLLQAALCLGLLTLLGGVLHLAAGDVVVRNFSSLQPIVEIEGMVGGSVLAAVALMLKLGFQVNVMLAFFNLIPVPPLDGSWIAAELSPMTIGRLYAVIRPYGFFIFIGLLYLGVLDYLLMPGFVVMELGHVLLGMTTGL